MFKRRLTLVFSLGLVISLCGCQGTKKLFMAGERVPDENVVETLCQVKVTVDEWRDIALANMQRDSREHQRAGELYQCLKVQFNTIVERAEYDAVRRGADADADYDDKLRTLRENEKAFIAFVQDVYLRQEFMSMMKAHRRSLEESSKGFVDHWTFQQYTGHFNKMLDDRKLNFSLDLPVERMMKRFVSLWNVYLRARKEGDERLVKFYQSLALVDFQANP